MTGEIVPLRSVASVLVSNVDKKSVDGDVPVRLCNYTDVYYQRRLRQDREYMQATATPAQRRAFGLRVGDTVITKDSETADDIGVASLVAESAPDFVCGYHLAVRRPRSDLEPRFLHWQVSSRFVQEQLVTRATGVTRYGLTYDAIRGVRLRVPSMQEQQRIADFLDDQVARLDAALAAVRDLRRLAAKELDAVWADEYAKCIRAGRCVPLRRVLQSIVDGPFGSSLTSAHYSDDGCRVIRLGNVGLAEFRDHDRAYIPLGYAQELRQHAVKAGDVIMAGLGDDRWPLGRCAVAPSNLGPAIVKADCYRLRPGRLVRPEYLAAALSAPQARDAIGLLARGSTRARLNTAVAREVPIAAVDDAAQAGFVRALTTAMRTSTQRLGVAQRLQELLEERKWALVTACVTGEFDVSAASSRAADAVLQGVR